MKFRVGQAVRFGNTPLTVTITSITKGKGRVRYYGKASNGKHFNVWEEQVRAK